MMIYNKFRAICVLILFNFSESIAVNTPPRTHLMTARPAVMIIVLVGGDTDVKITLILAALHIPPAVTTAAVKILRWHP